MQHTDYDAIAKHYVSQRCTDPIIAKQIAPYFHGASHILNIGAGAGSYQLPGWEWWALDASIGMLQKRTDNSAAVAASAEALPFADHSFSHAFTMLSLHHWRNQLQAFAEIKRVVTDKWVVVTFASEATNFWLTRDYFPEIAALDRQIFPPISVFEKVFNRVHSAPLYIPADCQDGFLAAYWQRPEAYLDAKVRVGISSFAKISAIQAGLAQLARDIASGVWASKNAELLECEQLDAGYRILEIHP